MSQAPPPVDTKLKSPPQIRRGPPPVISSRVPVNPVERGSPSGRPAPPPIISSRVPVSPAGTRSPSGRPPPPPTTPSRVPVSPLGGPSYRPTPSSPLRVGGPVFKPAPTPPPPFKKESQPPVTPPPVAGPPSIVKGKAPVIERGPAGSPSDLFKVPFTSRPPSPFRGFPMFPSGGPSKAFGVTSPVPPPPQIRKESIPAPVTPSITPAIPPGGSIGEFEIYNAEGKVTHILENGVWLELYIPAARYEPSVREKKIKDIIAPIHSLPTRAKINLFDDQIVHVDELSAIYQRSNIAITASETGSGKTYAAGYLAQNGIDYPNGGHLNFKYIVVIGPAMSENAWRDLKKEGVAVSFISKDTLKGTVARQPKGELLHRDDRIIAGKNIITFQVTSKFETMVAEGMLLVIDEGQMVRNKETATSLAVSTLTRYIIETYPDPGHSPSKILIATATPFDKAKSSLVMFNILGIDINVGSNEGVIANILKFIESIDPQAAYYYYNMLRSRTSSLKKDDFIDFALNIYVNVVVPAITSSMSLNIYDPAINYLRPIIEVPGKEGYNQTIYDNAIRDLSRQTSRKDQWDMGVVTKALESAEWAKRYTFLWEGVRQMVDWYPDSDRIRSHNKVPLIVRFIETANFLRDELEKVPHLLEARGGVPYGNNEQDQFIIDILNLGYPPSPKPGQGYGVRLITGEANKKTRTKSIAEFQEDNNRVRFLILTQGTGSVSISIHDLYGNYPRRSVISPASYSAIDNIQSLGRTRRRNGKSITMVMFLYMDYIPEGTERGELRIMDSLSRKSSIIRKLLVGKYRETAMFPSEFIEYKYSERGFPDALELYEENKRRIEEEESAVTIG